MWTPLDRLTEQRYSAKCEAERMLRAIAQLDSEIALLQEVDASNRERDSYLDQHPGLQADARAQQ